MKYTNKIYFRANLFKIDFNKRIDFGFKATATFYGIFLFVFSSTAQNQPIEFFVSEGTPVVGHSSIHIVSSVTNEHIGLDSIPNKNQLLSNAQKESTKAISINKKSIKVAVKPIKKINKVQKQPELDNEFFVFENKQKRNSSIFSTENSSICSTNSTQKLDKKIKIYVSSSNEELIFTTSKRLRYNFIINKGFQQVNYKLFFSRPPPFIFS